MKLGTPNYNSDRNSVRKNYFKLKDGDNVYRILPPCFSYAESGKWSEFYSIHFGYRGSKKNAKGVGNPKPFICPLRKDRTTKEIIVPCAEHARNEEVQNTLKERKEALEKARKNPEDIKKELSPLTNYLMEHNNEKKWYLNVKSADGSMGCLKVPHKAFMDLRDTIQTVLSKYGIDPIEKSGGVWFNFKRTKTGPRISDVGYKVEVEMEMVNTPQGRFETIKKAPLSPEDEKRMETECFDLSKMYNALSPEQVQMLVDNEGDPTIVDQVFGRPTPVDSDSDGLEVSPDSEESPAPAKNSMSPEEFKRRFTS